MARPPAAARRRPLGARALAAGAASSIVAAPLLLAAPAQAQTAPLEYSGATAAFALRLQVNLPEALEALTIDLQIDPVTGRVSTVDNTSAATAQVLGSSAGLLQTVLDAAEPLKGISQADQANPGPVTNAPVPAFPAPLDTILQLGLIESSATASADGTSSTSTASVAELGLALGDQLADAAAPLIDAIAAAQGQVVTAISAQLPLLTGPLCTSALPALEPLLTPLGLNPAIVATVCTLPAQLANLSADLTEALQSLGDNLLGTGLIQTSQTISSTGGAVTSTATASIAGLGLLGTGPIGEAGVVQSSATATTTGQPGGATADAVAPIVADINIGALDPLTDLQVTLEGLLGTIGGGPLTAPLTTAIQDLLDVVNGALAPIGASVITLDDAAATEQLEACPTELTGLQAGEFAAADGSCAAAATRGIGVEVTLPEALATPLGIEGPFVSLALSPAAAVAQAAVAPVVTPPGTPTNPVDRPLPRTGLEGALGATALAALAGGALLRRRASA